MTKYLKFLNTKCGKQSKLEINNINRNKSIVLIIPGGGYEKISPRETTPIANRFNELGYNSAILYYSVYPYTYKTNTKEANVALSYLKRKYKNIFLIGFSAGGHLASLLALNKAKDINALCLCYPVISLINEYHKGSRNNFLNKDDNDELAYKYSIEKQLDNNFPPTFLWTTKDDNIVPYQNTLMMIDALNKNNIINESIIYPHGVHGLALADETTMKENNKEYINKKVAQWPLLCDKFFKKFIKY